MVTTRKINERREVFEWAIHYLLSNGYELREVEPDIIQDTPWSYVARFITSSGHIYLKCTPKLLGLEVDVIRVLSHEFQASVPEVIVHQPSLHCFLMKDAGATLRSILQRNFDTDLVCKAVNQFAATQLKVADKLNGLMDIGVPDWRVDKLPDLYQQLLLNKELLVEDGLSANEIQQLQALFTKVTELCEKLSSYAIKQSIVQPDFNDNNTLVDESSHKMTMIDFGELSISHPFFSVHNFLLQMKKRHGLTENDARHLKIKDAYLSNYMHCGSKEDLREAFFMTQLLFPVYCALSDERLLNACDETSLRSSFPGQARPGRSLKGFLVVLNLLEK